MRSLFLTSALLLCWVGTCFGLTVYDLGRHGMVNMTPPGLTERKGDTLRSAKGRFGGYGKLGSSTSRGDLGYGVD